MRANHDLIAKNIIKHRMENNLTQKTLAELLEIAPNSLSAIECGRKGASINMLLKIANILNLSVDCLLEGNVIHRPHYDEIDLSNECHKNFYEELKYSNIEHNKQILGVMEYYIKNIKTK